MGCFRYPYCKEIPYFEQCLRTSTRIFYNAKKGAGYNFQLLLRDPTLSAFRLSRAWKLIILQGFAQGQFIQFAGGGMRQFLNKDDIVGQ